MALQGGDREFGHGDQITVVYDENDNNGPAVGGEAVVVTGEAATGDHVNVELAGDGEDSDLILADGAVSGEAVQAIAHGLVWARVDADTVSASDTVGEVGSGLLGDAESDYRVYQGAVTDSESEELIALVRYEN